MSAQSSSPKKAPEVEIIVEANNLAIQSIDFF